MTLPPAFWTALLHVAHIGLLDATALSTCPMSRAAFTTVIFWRVLITVHGRSIAVRLVAALPLAVALAAPCVPDLSSVTTSGCPAIWASSMSQRRDSSLPLSLNLGPVLGPSQYWNCELYVLQLRAFVK